MERTTSAVQISFQPPNTDTGFPTHYSMLFFPNREKKRFLEN